MPDLFRRIDPSPLILGLLGVACGPLAPQDTDTGDSTSGGPGPGTDPSDPTTTDPSDPSNPSDPTDPTGNSTSPMPECNSDADCDQYCGYCTDDGRCEEGVGCCGDYGLSPPPRGNKFRCSPYYECYDELGCSYSYACVGQFCEPTTITVLPPCEVTSEVFKHWNLSSTPSAFVLADLDGDQDLDIAAAQPGVAQIELALNDGAGEFVLAGAFGVGAPLAHLSIAAGDLDGDGDIDLAIARQDLDGGLILAFGQDGKFTPGPLLPGVGGSLAAVLIADVNADGYADIVTIHDAPQVAGVRTGILGNFGEEVLAAPEAVQPSASTVDADGDSRADLLSPSGVGEAFVWSAIGNGDFSLLAARTTAASAPTLVAADLDLLGSPELLLTGGANELGTVAVWRASGDADWAGTPQRFGTSLPLRGAVLADVLVPNGLDLIAATDTTTLIVVAGDGVGGFSCERQLALDAPTAPGLFAAADVDGDGVIEVVVGDPNSPDMSVMNF